MGSSDPCPACGWTVERQECCRYESNVKLFYGVSNLGVWSLGSKLVLKDRGVNPPTYEVPNIQFLQNVTSIPIPAVVESWEEGNHILILMKRVPGVPLSEAWPNLSMPERETIARETAEYLLQLRKLQSDSIQGLDGRPFHANLLFMGNGNDSGLPYSPLASDEALWAGMEPGLKDTVPEAARRRLRQRMPTATPYTFTHNDLTNVNIMVENGHLTGIIDWERSGYLPVWWEYVHTYLGDSEEDAEWKKLLRKFMPDYSAALEFWLDYYFLCRDPTHERAKRFLEETESETL